MGSTTDRERMRVRLDHLVKAVDNAYTNGEIGTAVAVKLSLRIEDMLLSLLDLDARDQPSPSTGHASWVTTQGIIANERGARLRAERERDELLLAVDDLQCDEAVPLVGSVNRLVQLAGAIRRTRG